MNDWNAYEDGAAFAQEVQEALRAGKTFDDMNAMEPGRAAHVRDIYKRNADDGSEFAQEYAPWWDGYVSRWD